MSGLARIPSLGFLLIFGSSLLAQDLAPADKPAPAAPAALAPAEQQQQEAKKLYALGVLQKRQDRYLEAIRSLEECVRLDSEAAPPYRLLAALYRTVGRLDEALAAARTVVAKYPNDFEGWERCADLLKELGKPEEAVQALAKAADCPGDEEPEQRLLVLQRLAALAEKLHDYAAVQSAAQKSLQILDKHRDAFRRSGFLSDTDILIEKGDAFERIGQAELKLERFHPALSAYTAAAKLFDGRDDNVALARRQRLHYHLAELHQARGESAAGLEHLGAYLKLKPQSIEPYRLLVALARKSGGDSEALARLADYSNRDPSNAALQLYLAEQYAQADRYDDARSAYDALISLQPKVEYYRGLLKLQHRHHRMDDVRKRLDEQITLADDAGKTPEARELANKHARAIYSVLRDNPGMIHAILPLAEAEMMQQIRFKMNMSYKTFGLLGQLAAQSREPEAAERLLREALTRVAFPGLKAAIDEPLIQVLMARRKYAEVVELCDERLRRTDMNLNQFMYRYYKAMPESRVAGLEPALATIDQAILDAQRDDHRLSARVAKVNILLWHDDKSRAIDEAEKLLKDFALPSHVRRIRLTLARVYDAARDNARSEKQLRMILDADPNDVEANNSLGYQLADQGRSLDEAERLIRRAIDLNRAAGPTSGEDDDDDVGSADENAAYLDSLGWVLFRRGKPVEALEWLEKAVALPGGQDDPSLWDHLGDVRFRVGDAGKAKAAWMRAAKLYDEERRTKKDGRYDELRRKLALADAPR